MESQENQRVGPVEVERLKASGANGLSAIWNAAASRGRKASAVIKFEAFRGNCASSSRQTGVRPYSGWVPATD